VYAKLIDDSHIYKNINSVGNGSLTNYWRVSFKGLM